MSDYCGTCEFISEMDYTQLQACECNSEVAPTTHERKWSYV